MNKLIQISTDPPKIAPLTTDQQAQIKGGTAGMCDEKRKRVVVK